MKYFEQARQEFLDKNYDDAISTADKALRYDAYFIEAHLLKAETCLELYYDSLAIKSYEQVFRLDSMAFPKAAISLSKLYAKSFLFDKSIALLNWYLSLPNQDVDLIEIAKHQVKLTEYRKSLVENPVDYNPNNIGSNVNTSADEYVNQFFVKENKLIYTKRYKSDNDTYLEENVFVSVLYDSIWTYPRLLFDSLENIGAANMSSDANEIYFAAISCNMGLGSYDIYRVTYKEGNLTLPENIKSVNTSDWESQPCISRDGSELYFVRRNKRLGTSDIYVSLRDDNGNWLKPNKLNSNINTDGNEMAPFIHHDGNTLFFSSDTHSGMGGYDLFVSRKNEYGEWSAPVNLGYPLNTGGDEINIVVSNDAEKAYMSAFRNDGYGAYDIYEFNLDEDFRPDIIELADSLDEDYYAEALNRYETVVLNNIRFEFAAADLTSDSAEGIMAVFNFLNSNPEKTIILEGHTDDMGDNEYNMQLSEKRAESVKKALVDKGISSARIIIEAYGSTNPLVPNDSEVNRSLNRRVEMKIAR